MPITNCYSPSAELRSRGPGVSYGYEAGLSRFLASLTSSRRGCRTIASGQRACPRPVLQSQAGALICTLRYVGRALTPYVAAPVLSTSPLEARSFFVKLKTSGISTDNNVTRPQPSYFIRSGGGAFAWRPQIFLLGEREIPAAEGGVCYRDCVSVT
jgi:hypothetical protein